MGGGDKRGITDIECSVGFDNGNKFDYLNSTVMNDILYYLVLILIIVIISLKKL